MVQANTIRMEDWTIKLISAVGIAVIAALLTRLYDALHFEKKFVTHDDLKTACGEIAKQTITRADVTMALTEFETSRLGEVRRDILRLQNQSTEVLAEIKALSKALVRFEGRIDARSRRHHGDTDE